MKTRVKWPEIITACKYITNKLKKNKIDIIVAISRGGLIPSRIIAKHLNIRRIYSLGMESYNDSVNKANEMRTILKSQSPLLDYQIFKICEELV